MLCNFKDGITTGSLISFIYNFSQQGPPHFLASLRFSIFPYSLLHN